MGYLGEIFALSAAFFWAIGVILFKKSGSSFDPLTLNFFKTAVGAVLLVPTVWLIEKNIFVTQSWQTWGTLMFSGFIGIALADTCFLITLNRLGASLTAVVDTAYMPIVFGTSFILLDEAVGIGTYVGGGLIMLALLVGSATRRQTGLSRRFVIEGILIGLLGITLMAVGIVMVKDILDHAPLLWVTAVRLWAGGLGLIPLLLFRSRRGAIRAIMKPNRAWWVALTAAIFGNYLAMIMWVGGMKYALVSSAAALNQMSTIFIFILAAVFLKEPVTRRRLVAIALAFVGAMVVVA